MKKILLLLLLSFNMLFSQEKSKINIELVNFSDSNNDFSPSLYKDGILFSTDRDKNSNYYKLYYYDFKSPLKKVKISQQMFHTGDAFYDASNDIIYITRSVDEKSLTRINLAIYKGIIKDFKITELEKLNFCNSDYSYAYAQKLGDKLLILTNQFNNSFSLVTYQYINHKWLNPQIIYSDHFPMLHLTVKDENTIFFGSKRKGGVGGVDLYKLEKVNGYWGEPINLTEFNTEFDDISILFVNDKEGYLSSNRLNKTDHIFRFTIE